MICYVTDNELFPSDHARHDARYVERLTEFVRGADVLITDTTYTDEEYERRIGWGHSSVRRVAELAHRAEVANLYLFHHDPEQSDDAIDAKLAQARAVFERLGSKTRCHAPAEGSQVEL
jgi:ribonuclease BN (tRNA processing enzyme)